MTSNDIREGMLVEHPAKPEWGPGKVAHVGGNLLYVFFRDLPDRQALKFRPGLLIAAPLQSDSILDNLPPFIERDGQLLLPNERLTTQRARERFLRHHPGGFADAAYIGSNGERTYKWQAHERFAQAFCDGRGRDLLSTGKISELVRELVTALGSARNLLATQENIAFREGLEDEDAAQRYFSTLFDLIDTGPEESAFTSHIEAVTSLPAKGATHTDKWTIATVGPFLARPDTFMFVKPDITKPAAAGLGFDIHYDARPNWTTFDAVLRMSRLYLEKLVDLGPQDFIDVQSFFWVTSDKYEKAVAAHRAKHISRA